MNTYYLAVDIGASSGRHILGWTENDKLNIEEIYRFNNALSEKHGHLCWNIKYLFGEIINGLKKCREIGKIPSFMGIDTWGVDFVLLDSDSNIIGDTVGYRDNRTNGMDKKVFEIIPEEELYKRTGIQKQIFNTIYQLMAIKQSNPGNMERADDFLMIPDYFNFLLTGIKTNEYTNVTTSQLVSHITKNWDYELIEKLGFKKEIFKDISKPVTVLGNITPEIKAEIGYDLKVILPATHDTGSAVIAVPSSEESPLYISSGTWSLLGTERETADCSMGSMKANFTNEGGINYRFRYLKNIMGLWMIQSVKKELNEKYSFQQFSNMAEEERDFPSIVDVNDNRFLSPESMTDEIKNYCIETGQKVPQSSAQIAAVIYNSLAQCYKDAISKLERELNTEFSGIYIVGGGCNNDYLCRATASATGKDVFAGPSEATAIGNITAQMLCTGELTSISQGRKLVFDSFDVKKYRGETK